MKANQITVKQAAEILNLSRVRVLGLVKAGKLVGKSGFVEGTTIKQVLIDRASVEGYVPSHNFAGGRSMIVNLPATELAEFEKICAERGWKVRAKNAKQANGAAEASYEDLEGETEDDPIADAEEVAEFTAAQAAGA